MKLNMNRFFELNEIMTIFQCGKFISLIAFLVLFYTSFNNKHTQQNFNHNKFLHNLTLFSIISILIENR